MWIHEFGFRKWLPEGALPAPTEEEGTQAAVEAPAPLTALPEREREDLFTDNW